MLQRSDEPLIIAYLDGKNSVTVSQILDETPGLTVSQSRQSDLNNLGRWLSRQGWYKYRDAAPPRKWKYHRRDGRQPLNYQPPKSALIPRTMDPWVREIAAYLYDFRDTTSDDIIANAGLTDYTGHRNDLYRIVEWLRLNGYQRVYAKVGKRWRNVYRHSTYMAPRTEEDVRLAARRTKIAKMREDAAGK